MNKHKLSNGTAHKISEDLSVVLNKSKKITDLWEGLTPLGRNEFICWVEKAKQEKTRARRIQRTMEELLEGKRRPCCWAGCSHRGNEKK